MLLIRRRRQSSSAAHDAESAVTSEGQRIEATASPVWTTAPLERAKHVVATCIAVLAGEHRPTNVGEVEASARGCRVRTRRHGSDQIGAVAAGVDHEANVAAADKRVSACLPTSSRGDAERTRRLEADGPVGVDDGDASRRKAPDGLPSGQPSKQPSC